MANWRKHELPLVHSSSPGAKQFAHSVGASSKDKRDHLVAEKRFSQSMVQHRTQNTTNIQNVAVTAELGAKPKLFKPSIQHTPNPPASSDETSRKVNRGPSTRPSETKNGATSAEEAEICVIRLICQCNIHGMKKSWLGTVEYECTIDKYMKWRFLQCSQLKKEELSSDGYCLHQDSIIDLKKSASNSLHVEKLAKQFIDQIVDEYCNDVSVETMGGEFQTSVLNQVNKQDVHAEIINGVFYMACQSNQKLHIVGSVLDLIKTTGTYDNRNCQTDVKVKHDLLKFYKMVKGKLCQDFPKVTFEMQEQSGYAVCTLRGSPEDIDNAVPSVKNVDKQLYRLPVDLMPIAAKLLLNSNVLNKVQHKLSSQFPECLLSVEDEHISVIGFDQKKMEQAAELVAGLISTWTKKLSERSSVKANDILHHIQKTFGNLVVVQVDTSLQMYVCGLKEDVDKVKTLSTDIEEGRVSLEKSLPFPEQVSGSTCSYQFQIGCEGLTKFLKKSTYLKKLARLCNCEVIFRTDNDVEINGDEAATLEAKHELETFLKEIKDEKIYIAKHNEQEYIQSSLQFVSKIETECDISIETVYKRSITSNSNLVIEKETCCGNIRWETNFSSSRRKLIVQEFDEKTDYEGLQMNFIKAEHDRSSRWSKTDNTLTVNVPDWIDGKQTIPADFSSVISKGLDKMSSRQIDKVVIYAQPVGGWEFCQFMQCIMSECTQWLVQSPNISPWQVTVIIDGSDNKDLTDTYVDTLILHYMNINVDERPVVRVVEGTLDQTEADILVNTAAPNLDLKHGNVSKALSKAAGPKLQSECFKGYPDGINYDDVAFTEGFRLRCNYVFHVTIPAFSMDATNLQQNFLSIRRPIMNCLGLASKKKVKTIAFPAIGTGKLGFPTDVVASEMFDSIKRFRQENPRSSLREVLFVIHKKDTDVLERFRAFESTFAKNTEAMWNHDMWLEITGLPKRINSAQREIEKKMHIISDPNAEITECFGDIPKSVCTVFFEVCYGKVAEIRKLTKFYYDEHHQSFTITGKVNAVVKCLVMVSKNIETIRNMHQCQLPVTDIDTESVNRLLTGMKESADGSYFLAYDKEKRVVELFAFTSDVLQVVNKDMKAKLKRLLDENNKQKNTNKLNPEDARKCELEEEAKHSIIDKGNHEKEKKGARKDDLQEEGKHSIMDSVNKERKMKGARSLLQRSFSWSQDTSSLEVFKTKYLVVKVYKADILTVPVDAIVNAANGTLEHCGGVAKKIAKHAGKDLVEESKKIIKKEQGGQLPVGSVVVTTAGCLPYKWVFHAVGPRWSGYKPMTKDNLKRCKSDLQITIANCFMKADEIELETIALPMISSGLFGVPVEICAEQYALAIIKYARNESLKEVHFVNNDSQSNIIPIIQKVFSEMITNNKPSPYPKDQYLEAPVAAAIQHVPGTGTAKDKLKNTCRGKPASVGEVETNETIKRVTANEITVTVNVCHRTEDNRLMCIITEKETCLLNVYEGDIFSIENVEALVCGENKDGGGQGMIAKELRKHGGNKYLEAKASLFKTCPNISEAVTTSGGGSKYKWIMFVIMSRNSIKLYDAYRNVFEEARFQKFQSIVLPLLGTGSAAVSTRDSAEALWFEWIQYCEKYRDDLFPLNVHVVLNDPAVLMEVQNIFKTFVDNIVKHRKDTSDADTRKLASVKVVKKSTDDDDGSKTKKSKVKPASKMEESCVICMDTMDNPKKLKCGHSFCTDCIDGYFKVKQVCPTCGQVCGIITGDQPDGFLDICKRRIKLEGYDKNTCFALTYTFLASVQGPNHPQPGKHYKMMRRTGYLPDTKEGRTVCAMMKVAFERRLVFTIGTSRTTGEQGVITWNDIHHKTDPKPNTQFGYPDPTYLDRVTDELAAKGVTPADIDKAFLIRLKAEQFKETICSGTRL